MELHPYYKDVVTYEHKLKACTTESERKSVDHYLKQYEEVFDKQLEAAKKKLGAVTAEEKENDEAAKFAMVPG